MDKILAAIHEACPKYNDYLLEGYRKESIDRLPVEIEKVWKAGLQIVKNPPKYVKYEVVPPMERAKYEMSTPSGRVYKALVSEVSLLKYKFIHNGAEYNSYHYVPYLKDRCLVIKGKKMSLILGIIEQIFTRFTEKHKKGKFHLNCEGIMIRPIRTPVKFYRFETLTARDENSDFAFSDFIVTGKLYNKDKSNKPAVTSIVLYLICKLTLPVLLKRVNLNPEDFVFKDQVDPKDTEFYYFSSNPNRKKTHRDPIYVCVRKTALENVVAKRIVVNILYTLYRFPKLDFGDLNDPENPMFCIILGKLTNANKDYPEMEALNSTENHFNSIDKLIDPVSLERFKAFLPNIGNDIYDILIYLLLHIDDLLVNKDPKNLFSKRIDATTSLLIDAYAKPINNRMFEVFKSENPTHKEITHLFNIKRMSLLDAINSQRGEASRTINSYPNIPNDSWIACCGIDKHRPDGGSKTPFDPSMPVVESILSFTGNRIGDTGCLNPFCEIESQGRITPSPDFDSFIKRMRHILQKW